MNPENIDLIASITTYSSMITLGVGITSIIGAIYNHSELENRLNLFLDTWDNVAKTNSTFIPEKNASVEEYLVAASGIYKHSTNNSNKNFVCLEDSIATLQLFRSLAKLNNRDDLLMKARYKDGYGLSEGRWVGHAYIIYDSDDGVKPFEATINTPLVNQKNLALFWEKNKHTYQTLNFKPIISCYDEVDVWEFKNKILVGGFARSLIYAQHFKDVLVNYLKPSN